MSISTEIQSLAPSALIELFVLDMSNSGAGIAYFHAGTNELRGAVVWQGQSYQPFPIEASGFDLTTKGTLPRPKLRVANQMGFISALIRDFDDLVGAKLIRKRTFQRYLDAVNFVGGVNPTADVNQHLNDDLYFIEQKSSESRDVVEWELVSAFDLHGVKLPRRQVIQNTCMWKYKGAECGYTGTAYFDGMDRTTTEPNDVCGKRLSSCKLRFGKANSLPFGGFPGATRNAF